MVTTMAASQAGIAAGLSQRRLKKLGFKQLLSIQRGSSGSGLSLLGATESAIENEDQQDKGLGVDASEITEHHLQAALSSSQLASDAPQNSNNAQASGSKPSYHIPTPDAKSVLMQREYHVLYPQGVYSDPVTYVRSSETCEDTIRGPAYTLDEDDNDWLEARNKKASEALAAALKTSRPAPSAIKTKGKEKARAEHIAHLGRENVEVKVISADEFEMVITVFEQVTADKVPFVHLDLSKLPGIDELLPEFDPDSALSEMAEPELPEMPWEVGYKGQLTSSATNTEWSADNPYRNLAALKNIARVVHPWWKQRREERDGRTVTPSLNFDESKEDDPYVCFRRREVKMIRKTRKTDAMHIEKLVRLRHELQQSSSLLSLLAQRERTKRATVGQDRILHDSTRELLLVKQQCQITGPNEGREDEELVAGEKRDEGAHGVAGAAIVSKKKRKTEEAATAASNIVKLNRKPKPLTPAAAANQSTVSTPGADGASAKTPASATSSAGDQQKAPSAPPGIGPLILRRVEDVQNYIERECQRKQESDVGWEEGTDVPCQPLPLASSQRSFRSIHIDASSAEAGGDRNTAARGLGLPSSPARAGRPASFRRRMARGGRVFLDRKLPAPSPVPANLSDWPRPPTTSSSQPADSAAISSTADKGKASENAATSSSTQSTARTQSQPSATAQPSLTGPFAFSAAIRPSLLASAPIVATYAASSPLPAVHGDVDADASDASSSASSHHSKESMATTMATSVEEGRDEEKEERQRHSSRDVPMVSDDESDDASSEASDDEAERWLRVQEQWRYDDDGGRWAGLGLCGLGGMEDDDEAIIDDFDQRFMRYRMKLLEDADLLKLSTDLANVTQGQAAADAPAAVPAEYTIFHGEQPSMYQQQQALIAQQHQQQQAAAAAAAASVAQASMAGRVVPPMGAPNAMLALQQAQAAQQQGKALSLQQQQILQAQQQALLPPQQPQQQPQQQQSSHYQLVMQQQAAARAAKAQALAAANAAAAAANGQQPQAQGQQMPGQGQMHGVGSPATKGAAPSPMPRSQSTQQHPPPHVLAQAFASSLNGMNGSPMQLPAGAVRFPAQQNGMPQFPASLGLNANGNTMPSPQMAAQMNRPMSGSPAPQQRASPHSSVPQTGSYQSSPAQGNGMQKPSPLQQQATVPQSTQQQQQQQQRMPNGNFNMLNGNGQLANTNPLAVANALQQAQAAMQAQANQSQAGQQGQMQAGQQQNGQAQQGQQNQGQGLNPQALLALQQALASSGNLQLKLPQNRQRAMQMVQQAAKIAQQQQQLGQQGSPRAQTGMPQQGHPNQQLQQQGHAGINAALLQQLYQQQQQQQQQQAVPQQQQIGNFSQFTPQQQSMLSAMLGFNGNGNQNGQNAVNGANGLNGNFNAANLANGFNMSGNGANAGANVGQGFNMASLPPNAQAILAALNQNNAAAAGQQNNGR